MPERFDVIVVGAGPAGTTAALALAQAGLKVIIFERGEQPGTKNMFGGMLFNTPVLTQLLPDFWEKAPVERFVTKHILTFATLDSSFSVSYKDSNFREKPYNGVTLLRAKFDSWYAEKAQEAGAFLVPETVVDDIIWDGNRAVGVRTGRSDGAIYADVVIIADGANSLLAKKAGLRREFSPTSFAVAAKELLALPVETIEARFGLEGNEGLAQSFIGTCTQGLVGGAFLYTNKDSISLGIVANLDSLQKSKIPVNKLLDDFKSNPVIRHALEGATLKEYSGHLIPEEGINMMPELCGDGILVAGDAAGFLLSTGLTLEGMNFAIASGFSAAEAAKLAKQSGNFSKQGLSAYKDLIEETFLKDLDTFRRAPNMMSNPRLYDLYPSLVCGTARRIYKVTDQPRKKLLKLVREEMKGKITMWQLAKDILRIGRALLWP